LQARISSCRPPAAALLILTPRPRRTAELPSGRRAAAANGTLATTGVGDAAACARDAPVARGAQRLEGQLPRIADELIAAARWLERSGDGVDQAQLDAHRRRFEHHIPGNPKRTSKPRRDTHPSGDRSTALA
jgi:hypothetical protein